MQWLERRQWGWVGKGGNIEGTVGLCVGRWWGVGRARFGYTGLCWGRGHGPFPAEVSTHRGIEDWIGQFVAGSK